MTFGMRYIQLTHFNNFSSAIFKGQAAKEAFRSVLLVSPNLPDSETRITPLAEEVHRRSEKLYNASYPLDGTVSLFELPVRLERAVQTILLQYTAVVSPAYAGLSAAAQVSTDYSTTTTLLQTRIERVNNLYCCLLPGYLRKRKFHVTVKGIERDISSRSVLQ